MGESSVAAALVYFICCELLARNILNNETFVSCVTHSMTLTYSSVKYNYLLLVHNIYMYLIYRIFSNTTILSNSLIIIACYCQYCFCMIAIPKIFLCCLAVILKHVFFRSKVASGNLSRIFDIHLIYSYLEIFFN